MTEEQRIHELALKLVASQRKFEARTINEVAHSKNIEAMTAEANLHRISPLSVSNYAMSNLDKLEKELESAGYADSNIRTLSGFKELFEKRSSKSSASNEFHEALAKHVKMIPDFDYHK